MFKIFKRKNKTFKVRIYNKHTDDEHYCLMSTHTVDKNTIEILKTVDKIRNSHFLEYSIDNVMYDTQDGVYILNTSTIWSHQNQKPSCYTPEWFIVENFKDAR